MEAAQRYQRTRNGGVLPSRLGRGGRRHVERVRTAARRPRRTARASAAVAVHTCVLRIGVLPLPPLVRRDCEARGDGAAAVSTPSRGAASECARRLGPGADAAQCAVSQRPLGCANPRGGGFGGFTRRVLRPAATHTRRDAPAGSGNGVAA